MKERTKILIQGKLIFALQFDFFTMLLSSSDLKENQPTKSNKAFRSMSTKVFFANV
jgi:hypothetical protein